MKAILLSITCLVLPLVSQSQNWKAIDFDNAWSSSGYFIDTISNPNCRWQVGKPQKQLFTSAFTAPNAIVTDTLQSVPANDTSIFYIKFFRNKNQPGHFFTLNFKYMLDGDSTDFGTVEISPDSGKTWINLITQDTVFDFGWWNGKPVLNGSVSGWSDFQIEMAGW